MSLIKGIQNPAIDNLIAVSGDDCFEWILYEEEISEVESSQIDNIYYAIRRQTYDTGISKTMIMLVLLGSSEECTATLVSEFARIYSLPTHKHNIAVSQYRRYSYWIENRNELIEGFTEYENNYYMVADKRFYYCYFRYGFCSACRILRCSPVWCIRA